MKGIDQSPDITSILTKFLSSFINLKPFINIYNKTKGKRRKLSKYAKKSNKIINYSVL